MEKNQLEVALFNPRNTTSFMSVFESQKELFESQIDQLHNIVLLQCNLTGVNPLSQEMAAGALSIKIGKRPRDLLNPKAIKYMHSIFAIKDAINKKETREISALFGVTVTQVRDFFTAQRTRVRKLLRLSREKASSSNASSEGPCAIPLSSVPSLQAEPVPLESVAPACTEEGPSCSTQDEILTGVEELDKHFLDNIFTLMKKEETFSGQVKLMDWILEVKNPSVLYWFLTKGGVMILATWLSQAAIEEQTSVLHVILKVLCHLPLHKAFPVHMSAILQSVNRLRFYRSPDISNRARILLANWSKMFAKSQAMKKRNGTKSASDVQDELLLQQSIGEVMGNEVWNPKVEDLEESHAHLSGASENLRKLDSPQPVKLLTASSDDKMINKGALASKNRERRKVQLMEHPSQRTTGRSPPVGRPAPVTQGRPLSADDIQKAKMRAHFLQTKYGKANSADSSRVKPEVADSSRVKPEVADSSRVKPEVADSSRVKPEVADSSRVKPEVPNGITSSQDGSLHGHGAPNSPERPKVDEWPKVDEREKLDNVALKRSSQQESHNKLNLDVEEPPWKRCRRMQIPWWKPPEVMMSDTWKVCDGSESKEVDIQNNRIRRERETIYRTLQEIPLNPKEPWDREMDPDDTLTTEIPIEQLPDAEGAETVAFRSEDEQTEAASTSMSNGSATTAEPDVELLAALLKNPELVFALTSGQAGDLSSEETVKLLDMVKANGMSSLSGVTDSGRNAEKKVEVSLPSPTPSSDPGTSGLKQDFTKNPFSQRSLRAVPEANGAALFRSQEKLQASNLVHSQVTSNTMLQPQQLPITPQLAQQLSLLQAAAGSFGAHIRPSPLNLSINQTVLANPTHSQFSASEPAVNRNNYSILGSTDYNLHSATVAAAAARMQGETSGNIRSSPMPMANVQQRTINVHLAQIAASHTQSRPQLQTQSQPGYAPEHMWGGTSGTALVRGYQENSIPNHHYHAHIARHVEPASQQAAWRGNNFVEEAGFESWSPDNSPARHQEHVARWNYSEPRVNVRENYIPDRSMSQNPGYYSGSRGPDDVGNRRLGDRRR